MARGRIRGHVTDPAGAPVTDGYARVYWKESGRWVPGPWGHFDDDGGYELRVDGERVYHVCFHPSDAASARAPVLERRAVAPELDRDPRRAAEPHGRRDRRAARSRRPDRGSDPRLPDRHPGHDLDPGLSQRRRRVVAGGMECGGAVDEPRRRSRSPASRPVRIGCASAPRTSSSSPCSPMSASAAARRRTPGPTSRPSPARRLRALT